MNTEKTLPSKAEQITARMLYNWLLIVWLLLFIAVCFMFALPIASTLAISLVIQVLAIATLAIGFVSPSSFVRWHTAQAIGLGLIPFAVGGVYVGLILLAAGGVTLDFVVTPVICNFFFWPIISFVGAIQARRGECGLQRIVGGFQRIVGDIVTTIDVLRPASQVSAPETPVDLPPEEAALETPPPPLESQPISAQTDIPTDPQTAFEQGLLHAQVGHRPQATACFMVAFRDGSPELRQRAIAELENLGEVGTF